MKYKFIRLEILIDKIKSKLHGMDKLLKRFINENIVLIDTRKTDSLVPLILNEDNWFDLVGVKIYDTMHRRKLQVSIGPYFNTRLEIYECIWGCWALRYHSDNITNTLAVWNNVKEEYNTYDMMSKNELRRRFKHCWSCRDDAIMYSFKLKSNGDKHWLNPLISARQWTDECRKILKCLKVWR